jgi:uncharacterized protein DUF6527
MPRIVKVANRVSFKCPGCCDTHTVPVEETPERGALWSWNGSLDKPTLSPSLAVTSGHHTSYWKPGDECWCDKDYGFSCYRCHSIITDGRIMFCADSSHALAGQTVDLPEIGG